MMHHICCNFIVFRDMVNMMLLNVVIIDQWMMILYFITGEYDKRSLYLFSWSINLVQY